MESTTNQRLFYLLLKVSVVTVFLGRAWQFLFWDAPYRTLLWDQQLMEGLVENVFGMTWKAWASSMKVDGTIQLAIRVTGCLYAVCAVAAVFLSKRTSWIRWILWVGLIFLVVLALLQTKEKFFHFGQFFEHASQLGVVVLFIGYVQGWMIGRLLINFGKSMVALTFFCHGLYAVNYYPRPGVFVDLLLNTLGVSESFAHDFIMIAGVIDLLIAVLIFVPGVSKIVLWYCAVWGLVTALSRFTAGFYLDFFWASIHQTWYTVCYRLVHGLLPLGLLVYLGAVNSLGIKTLSKSRRFQTSISGS